MKKIFFLFILNIILLSCARVGSPNGGKKDTIPPKFIGSNIDTTHVNVSKDLKELRIDFDEYITLKDINKNLIISPPLKNIKKILPSVLATKYLLIQWSDTLKDNTTYNFNFGNSILDNNEGNVLPYYNFAFSTSNKLDDLYISGTVKKALVKSNSKSSDTKEKATVVELYKDKDTIDFKQKPYYITKADEDGYYELNYLSPGKYKIIAFEDNNSNSVYDNGKEDIGFLKEKIVLEKSISGLDFNIYPSKKILKYIEMKEVSGGILMIFEGNPDEVKVSSLNEKLKDYKVTHQPKSDSVNIWFDAKKQDIGITGNDNLKFKYTTTPKTINKKDTVSIFYKYNPKNEMTISNLRSNLIAPNSDFEFASNMPIQNIQPEKWTLVADSIKQNLPFSAGISETFPNQIIIKSDFKQGKKYQLTVPKETLSSYFDNLKKSHRFDFEIDKPQNFGSFVLKLIHKPDAKFWIQLLDNQNVIVYSKYTDKGEIKFTELKPGDYTVRILVDNNGNGRWDEADFANQVFAEDAYNYNKKLNVKALWEIVETWDLKEKNVEKTSENPQKK